MRTGAEDRKHILVVEDDAPIAEMLQMLLQMEQYQVTIAPLGKRALGALLREAIEQRSAAPINLILLDLHLPGVDAVELMRPFGQRAQAVEQAAAEIEAFSYLCKPFKMDDLLRCVAAALNGPAQEYPQACERY